MKKKTLVKNFYNSLVYVCFMCAIILDFARIMIKGDCRGSKIDVVAMKFTVLKCEQCSRLLVWPYLSSNRENIVK